MLEHRVIISGSGHFFKREMSQIYLRFLEILDKISRCGWCARAESLLLFWILRFLDKIPSNGWLATAN